MDRRSHLRHGRIVAAIGVVALVGGSLGPVSVVRGQAEVIVELVPDHPGPYGGGQLLTVDVWLHRVMPWDVRLSHIQLDFSITDSALALDPTFTFDYSAILDAFGYGERHPELPVPWTANTLACGCPELFLPLPAGGSLHIGSIGVQMPLDPGIYRLDALNLEETEWSGGAMLSCYLDCKGWRASTGEIAGGTFDFAVSGLAIPTVSEWGLVVLTLLLLVAGSWTIKRCREEVTEPIRISGLAWCGALQNRTSASIMRIGGSLS